MVLIYCIEDINDLKYIGSTKQKIEKRLANHKVSKTCSSSKLNLYNSIIYPLEECEESERKERERYWINKIECVNTLKLNFNYKEYNKLRYNNNKDYFKEYKKQYNKEYYLKNKDNFKQYSLKNKDKIKEYKKQYNKEYYLKNKK